MKKPIILTTAIILAILGVFFVFRPPIKDPQFTVAANFPLTGEIGLFGENVRDSTIMALEDLSEGGDSERPFEIDWGDNAGTAKNTVSVFQKHMLRPPDLYISGFTPQTLAIKEQIDSRKLPHIAWVFSPSINEGTDNNFRTWVSYKIETPMYLDYIESRNPKRVAIVHVNLPYPAEQFTGYVIPQMKQMGVTDIMVEVYEINTRDYNTIAAKVKEFSPDLIILNGFGFTLTGIVKAMRPLDLINDGNTIGTYDMIDAQATLKPSELEGIRVVAPKFVTRPELVADWSSRFKERFNREPLFHNAYAYDMIQIINDAGLRLEHPANSQEWIAALQATNVTGITGKLSFDSDGDLETELERGVFRDGKLVPDRED